MRYIDYDSEDAMDGVELLHVNDAVITDILAAICLSFISLSILSITKGS
ncbi:hypothetical protein ES705_50629 [subsurface metagenome]